ncbi:hypothetical protein K4F52_005376 [Lecanicillium sp. MT-2017a]|nr:hypothetical protein K4F52_005376 [Lecanicillium sp. MT-2017a]
MSAPTIYDSYPEYAKTTVLDELRTTEYGFLDDQGHVYLDYTGAGLSAKSQLQSHAQRLGSNVLGNPHSINPTSEASTIMVEETRERILAHFNASPKEYAVVFTPNATGAARLVGESYQFRRGTRLLMTSDNHNSIHGLREYAKAAGTRVKYIHSTSPELRVETATVQKALNAKMAQEAGFDVLLDAAAYLPTGTLNLAEVKPQFVMMSWYKLLGYPTGVGCLIVRRDAMARLRRPWFSGGTIQAVSVGMQWHKMAPDEAAFEDGTLNFLSIPDVKVGLDWVDGIGMSVIDTRVRCLTGHFIQRLKQLKHKDGSPMIILYGPDNLSSRGGTVCFNFIDSTGRIVDERLVALESAAAGISLRTGCFCNPGAGEDAFRLRRKNLLRLLWSKTTSIDEYVTLIGLPSAGAIRVSFGVASVVADLDKFFEFAEATYRDRETNTDGLAPRDRC